MKGDFIYCTRWLGKNIEGKIMTIGVDWGYKNGQTLKIIYETENYYLLLSKGTTYLSGMSTPYSPAEYMIAHKKKKPIDDDHGIINILYDNITPGHKWKSMMKLLKEEVDKYQHDGHKINEIRNEKDNDWRKK